MYQIAVYGSLKHDKYNHPILMDSKFIGRTQVSGTLYSVGSYPALCEHGNNKYVAEVYEVSEQVYNSIRGMELGAGYKEVMVGDSIVYYADKGLAERCKENLEEIKTY